MEKTLSLGAFTELDKNELMETDGGWLGILVGAGVVACIAIGIDVIVAGAVNEINTHKAEDIKNANDPSAYYNYDRNDDGSNDCYRYSTYTWKGPKYNYAT